MTWAYAVGDLVSGKDNLAPNVQTNDFKDVQPVDEQMDAHERHRLLYVAATRARDHLVVSLHRTTGNASTNAKLLADSGAATAAGAQPFTARKFGASRVTSPAAVTAPPDWAQWLHRLRAAQDTTRWVSAIGASGLEGTEPAIALDVDESSAPAGAAKGARDVELPPWSKGRPRRRQRRFRRVRRPVSFRTARNAKNVVTRDEYPWP